MAFGSQQPCTDTTESPALKHSQIKVGMAGCNSCFWGIVWLIILLVLAWPISIFLGGLYGFIAPLTTCVGLDHLTELLMEGANLGRTCALNMRHGKPLC
ncbi:hypothetical protein GN956_G5675 [Arapaima gigas]